MSTEGQNEYKLKFDGEANQLDAATLGYSLLNFVEIVEQANLELETGKQIEIKVKAHEPGSFLVHFALQTGEIDNLWKLLSPDNLKLAGAIIPVLVAAVTGLFKLRKHLKGEPPKEVQPSNNEILLQNSNGNKIAVDRKVYNLYFNNDKVKTALSETFKVLDGDKSITGFEITDDQERPLFQASREEFAAMAISPSEPPELTHTQPVQNAILSIIKPCFERGLKWEVVYQGNKIFVAMKDEAFLARV